ncbi:MAG: hypothetical protein B6D44_02130 [Ignavibacteriales bacterium UTCHB2]|jgi:glycosyltransferase involved in cell wall biosynthesis|nr:MAG: hypothetical protein B6D44_02130 [Ignavibacteriales bacterium UTCHB2]
MLKKTVAIFINSLNKGGAERQAILLHNYLSQHFNAYLIIYNNLNPENHQILSDKNVIFLKGNTIPKIFQFYKFLKGNRITHLFNFLPLNNIAGIIIGKLAGVRYLYGGIRSEKYKSKFKMIIMKLLCNYVSSGFISNSYAAYKSYTRYGFNQQKLMVIQNAIDPVSIFNCPHPKIRILSVGRFIEEKDYFTSITALNLILKNKPELRSHISYNIIGYGKLEDKIKRSIELNKLDDITIFVNDGFIGESYQNSDIFLNTSKYEGMPNVIMEAMNNSLPMVATDAGDTKYLVRDNFNGFLCPIGNAEYISEKLITLINDNNLCKQMGVNSLKIIEENFRPDKVFTAYKDLIDNAK